MPACPSPPSSITHWLPLSSLGSGSFGHVSLALNLADGSLFAAKSSPAPLLLNELTILQSLNSPFIIHCLGADLRSALPHLFLEYMDAGSLADVLRRSASGKLRDENTIRYYTRAIAQGLHYLHHNGVVHCDIKSHNVLIGQSGVKIGDFGAAQRAGDAPAMGGALRGTPLYMAPEVLRGEEQGTPSDIWSLGCTVVEMLQGKTPWGHLTSLEALLLKVGSSDENPPLPEHISAEAKDFLLNCLRRDPKERASAAEILQHPFLCGRHELELEAQGDFKSNQPSPRSTLHFLYSSESESDCECESMQASVSSSLLSPHYVVGVPPSLVGRRSSEGSEWVTVRRAENCSRINEGPFMPAFTLSDEALQVRRGCEVSFDCAAFLNRRGTMVG